MTVQLRHGSLVDAVRANASFQPGATTRDRAPAIVFVGDDDTDQPLAYPDLLRLANGFAAALGDAGIRPGDRVLLILPTSPAFFGAFFGAMLAGAVPVPMALPAGVGSVDRFLVGFRRTAQYLGARHVVLPGGFAGFGASAPELALIAAEEVSPRDDAPANAVEPDLDDLAFIQCTSGSTGVPKGVMLTHQNLLANTRQIAMARDLDQRDVIVSWLPLNHDMGLIGGVLLALCEGFDTVLLTPQRFQRQPAAWLRAISRHRATNSPAPNFAFGYATARAKEEHLQGVDLSSWSHAYCGAEPIDARTLDAFEARFRAYGLRDHVLCPCYGLAEASVAVSIAPRAPRPVDTLDREHLADSGIARDVPAEHPNATRLVSCGLPIPGTRIRVVDASGRDLPEGHEGRVLVQGPSVTPGYWDLPDETAARIRDGWLDTGDRGYLRDGEIRITGRDKDIIIIRGKCYAPTDFEWAAQDVPGVRPGAIAAFGVYDETEGTEQLHLAVETKLPAESHGDLRHRVVAEVTRRTGVCPAKVHVVDRHFVPKTTSGKVQRSRTRSLLIDSRAA